MTTSLPAISPRNATKPASRRDVGLYSDYNAAATRHPESVSDWTPHDVAEWLYLQVRWWWPPPRVPAASRRAPCACLRRAALAS